MDRNKRQALLSWAFVGGLAVLAATLGFLQYGWIDEVSRAARERMQANLHTSVLRVSRDFNSEVTAACAALMPPDLDRREAVRRQQFATRYEQWKETSRHAHLFRTLSLATPVAGGLVLLRLNPETGEFQAVEWPAALAREKERLSARLAHPDQQLRGTAAEEEGGFIDLPIFVRGPEAHAPEHASTPPREAAWLLPQLDLDYVRNSMIPELLQRDLSGGAPDYQVAVVTREPSAQVIFLSGGQAGNRSGAHSGAERPETILANADASVRLFEVDREQVMRALFSRPGGAGDRRGWRGGGPRRPDEMANADRGRWVLSVRHRAGSVEAVVARARTRNLVTMAGILLLIMASVAAIVRFTRRSQRLAELQMEFVAGVSHELRTPLTVMRTAGFNLQGKVSADPLRVQRYGALIQAESQKLTAIVEQVLRFSNVKAGRVVGQQSEIGVEALIEEAIADHFAIVEARIAPELPGVQGDPTTLKLALQNLLSNAAKYGGGQWIGVTARLDTGRDGGIVEIRVSDHGPGIAPAEIGKIFDPFFRGKQAIADQIHGTGLGLSLAKRIVEAHHGTLSVHSEIGKGTEFAVRLPARAAA